MSIPVTPNTTHRLVGSVRRMTRMKPYSTPCNILKQMPDGKLKIEVFGERYRKTGKRQIRYVAACRVMPDTREIQLVGLAPPPAPADERK